MIESGNLYVGTEVAKRLFGNFGSILVVTGMNSKVIFVRDTDEIDEIAEIISKYNLLAVPVVDEDMTAIPLSLAISRMSLSGRLPRTNTTQTISIIAAVLIACWFSSPVIRTAWSLTNARTSLIMS